MKLPLSLLALACCLGACSQTRSPATSPAATAGPAAPAAGGSNDKAAAASTRLTVYSGDYDALAATNNFAPGNDTPGYALVDSQLHYALKAGSNVITLAHLPRAIDVAAVALRPIGAGITIDGQRYLAPPGNAAAVLAAAIGRRVAVEHTSGGAKQTDNGVLVAAGDGLTLALPDGRTKVIRQYDNFSLLDADQQSTAEPTLRWQVGAQRAGDAAFNLSYPTGGLAWRAEYVATLTPGAGCRLSLDGAALVANRSGVGYPNVALTLVAGEPNRVHETANATTLDRIEVTGSRMQRTNFEPEPHVSGEYYAYPLPLKTTLADGAIERVPLFAQLPAVACERAYQTSPALNLWQPPQPLLDPGFNQDTGPQPVKATVSFANSKDAGLGRPLPAGRVRVFDGSDFLGESLLPHTADGAKLDLEVGTAFDLSAERTRSEFRVDRAGRTMTESFAITLKNAKKTDATVRVVEPLPRWTDWEIVASSVSATKRDAQHAQFQVKVPAGGETKLNYTVRYRWTAGMNP
ncbi:MAG TPA: DUF4139 domain-containing protein [Luteimonas sp.]|nr:DUF4139 domain-containing protein [Luteimonas sp.]